MRPFSVVSTGDSATHHPRHTAAADPMVSVKPVVGQAVTPAPAHAATSAAFPRSPSQGSCSSEDEAEHTVPQMKVLAAIAAAAAATATSNSPNNISSSSPTATGSAPTLGQVTSAIPSSPPVAHSHNSTLHSDDDDEDDHEVESLHTLSSDSGLGLAAATATTATANSAAAAAPTYTPRRRFAAPAARAPTSAELAEGLVIMSDGRVLKRNYRRDELAAKDASPSAAGRRSGSRKGRAAAATTATTTAKRLRDRSALRRPAHLEAMELGDAGFLDDTDEDAAALAQAMQLTVDEEEEVHGVPVVRSSSSAARGKSGDHGLVRPKAVVAAAAATGASPVPSGPSSPASLQAAVAAIVARTAAEASSRLKKEQPQQRRAASTVSSSSSSGAAGPAAKKAKRSSPSGGPRTPRGAGAGAQQYPPQYISAGPGRPRKQKQCACCHTTSTPLWRDIGRALPLCNACGIRWKKYGLICPKCQYVPCKQERESKSCMRCSHKLPPASKKARLPPGSATPTPAASQSSASASAGAATNATAAPAPSVASA